MITASTATHAITAEIAAHPWRTVVRLVPVGIAVMLGIDAALGAGAEYFNAWHLVEAWGRVLTGGSIEAGATFLMHQDAMPAATALAIGTGVLFVQPAVALAAIVAPVSYNLRRRHR